MDRLEEGTYKTLIMQQAKKRTRLERLRLNYWIIVISGVSIVMSEIHITALLMSIR